MDGVITVSQLFIRWSNNSGLSRGYQGHHKSPLGGREGGKEKQRWEVLHSPCGFWDGGDRQYMEAGEVRIWSFLWRLQKKPTLLIPWFQLSKIQAWRTVRYCCCFKPSYVDSFFFPKVYKKQWVCHGNSLWELVMAWTGVVASEVSGGGWDKVNNI